MMRHYALDCKTKKEFRTDSEMLFHSLAHMAKFLGVKIVGCPIVRPYRDNECPFDDSGVSAFAFLLGGGHITIHTFDARGRFYMDILSNSKAGMKQISKYVDAYIFPLDFEQTSVRHLKPDCHEPFDESSHFGKHLIYKVKTDRYDDMATIYIDLVKIPIALLDMHVITTPFTILDEQGPQGIVLIAESHVSIHQRNDVAYIDVFSCKGFDDAKVDAYFSSIGEIVSKDSYARATKEEWK